MYIVQGYIAGNRICTIVLAHSVPLHTCSFIIVCPTPRLNSSGCLAQFEGDHINKIWPQISRSSPHYAAHFAAPPTAFQIGLCLRINVLQTFSHGWSQIICGLETSLRNIPGQPMATMVRPFWEEAVSEILISQAALSPSKLWNWSG